MANHTYKNWLTLCVPRVHPLSLVVILCKQCRFKPCNIFRYNPFPVTNTISFWLMLLSPPSFTSPPRSNWWISYQWQTMQGCIFQAPPLPQPRPGSSEFLPFSNLQIHYPLKVIISFHVVKSLQFCPVQAIESSITWPLVTGQPIVSYSLQVSKQLPKFKAIPINQQEPIITTISPPSSPTLSWNILHFIHLPN